jgi:hypothetical protein
MPLRIDYESRDFAATAPVGNGFASLDTSWGDLLWAVVTVGRPNWMYVFKNGPASAYEAMFRWSLLRMSLEQSGPQAYRLRRTAAARSLDPTEKGAVNYFLGVAMCKLFAAKRLNAPWALHLDVFGSQLATILPGRSRPDLIAQIARTNDWISMESKGRVSMPTAEVKTKAKAQAARVVAINGRPPAYKIGGITSFRKDILQFYWVDPTTGGDGNAARRIEVQQSDDSWKYYYQPIVEAFRVNHGFEQTEMNPGVAVAIPDADMKVTIEPRVAKLLVHEQWAEAKQLCGTITDDLKHDGYQLDGLRVDADENWLEPYKHGLDR